MLIIEFIYFVKLVSKKSYHLQHYAWSLILTFNFKSLLKEQNSTNIILILSDKTVSRLAHHRFSQKNNIFFFLLFAFLLFTTKKKSFILFLGESTAGQSAYSFIWPLWPPICWNKCVFTPKWINSYETNFSTLSLGWNSS